MADIFISYARADSAEAERLVAALEKRDWKVFIDRKTPIGPRFDQHIAEKLRAARCVVVLWSEASVNSEWVVEEAADAKKRDVLAPVRLQDVDPPFGFGHRNYADLFGWSDGRPHAGFDRLLARITELVGPPVTVPEIPPDYVAWLRRTCSDVSLLGQDPGDKSRAFSLTYVYVPAVTPSPAHTEAQVRTKKTKVPRGRTEKEPQPIPLLQRLDTASLYVEAHAGAGKSTFCKWAVLQCIAEEDLIPQVPTPKDFAEPAPKSLRGRLPLLVLFRDFAHKADFGRGEQTWTRKDLERALEAWVAAKTDGLPPDMLTVHLKAGTALLLLDGLDELPEMGENAGATVYPRELVLSGLADALPVWHGAGNRILLTSRPAGVERAGVQRLPLDHAPLEPLPPPLQDLFVQRWFHTLDKPDEASGLIGTIRGRADLAPLVGNPMLLTALCILYDSGGRLPGDIYKLYRRIVDVVLARRFPGGSEKTERVEARLRAIARRMHEGTESEPRSSPTAVAAALEVDGVLREIAADGWSPEDASVEPAVRRKELLDRSGLLLPRGDGQAAFYHLSFQEFLAAEELLKSGEDPITLIRKWSAVPEWRLTLSFLIAGRAEAAKPPVILKMLGQLLDGLDSAAVKTNPAPALVLADAFDLILAKGWAVAGSPQAETFRTLVLRAIEDEIDLPARQALALTLGRLGDPRIADLRDPAAYVTVPAGDYPYGEAGEMVTIEAPFLLGRYPVTNSQYRAFVDDGGYQVREWWSEAGWTWRKDENITEPWFWDYRQINAPNQPVVGVSFWEAEAFCSWAGGRLPTEQEWEAAARGPEGFTYPWGDDWEDGNCNSSKAGLKVTSAVGLFPRGRQARLGLEDFAGNVWEWCDNLYDQADSTTGANRVFRGGSWIVDARIVRSAVRHWFVPEYRNNDLGFRCARVQA